jgi:hypothetical protein
MTIKTGLVQEVVDFTVRAPAVGVVAPPTTTRGGENSKRRVMRLVDSIMGRTVEVTVVLVVVVMLVGQVVVEEDTLEEGV